MEIIVSEMHRNQLVFLREFLNYGVKRDFHNSCNV